MLKEKPIIQALTKRSFRVISMIVNMPCDNLAIRRNIRWQMFNNNEGVTQIIKNVPK